MPALKQTPTQTEKVYQALRRDIVECRLAPGSKIKMKYVCDTHGVSLGAAREALSRLSADGMTVPEAQRGYTVAPMSWVELSQLTETRTEIEVSCLRKSIHHGDIEWETRVVAGLHRLLRADDDGEKTDGTGPSLNWVRAHSEFHLALVSACPNTFQLDLRNDLYSKTERYRFLSHAMSIKLGQRDARQEHMDLAELAQARKTDEACALMTEHFLRTARDVLDAAKKMGGVTPNTMIELLPVSWASIRRDSVRD